MSSLKRPVVSPSPMPSPQAESDSTPLANDEDDHWLFNVLEVPLSYIFGLSMVVGRFLVKEGLLLPVLRLLGTVMVICHSVVMLAWLGLAIGWVKYVHLHPSPFTPHTSTPFHVTPALN